MRRFDVGFEVIDQTGAESMKIMQCRLHRGTSVAGVEDCHGVRRSRRRRGSALMIVMVLMGMLALIGVIFYTFAAQERSNAAYYSDAAKDVGDPSLTADILFDWALEQIIVGTDRRLTNSMLWGSRHSMLSNSLGYGNHGPGDLHPFNGEGVNLIYDSGGSVAVDQNRNGKAEDGVNDSTLDNRYLLDFNDSPAAPKQFESGMRQIYNGPRYFPQTDVGYTYPDINNVFLTYVGVVRDSNNRVHRVVKPAYHVPGLLRTPVAGVSTPLLFEDTDLNGQLGAGEDTNGNGVLDDWTLNPITASRVMRAHASHIYVPPTGITSNPMRRYLSDAEAISLIGPTAHGFPFHPMAATYDTRVGGGGPAYLRGRMGPYSYVDSDPSADDPIEFDYDNDGDGINESILMDLDFPPQQDSSGNLFVPLFLITIHDLDGLINLNAHGNLAALLSGPLDAAESHTPLSSNAGVQFGTDTMSGVFEFISKSNLGIAPSEVNPLWGLNSRIGVDNDPSSTLFALNSQYVRFFGNNPSSSPGSSWAEAANMEFAWSKLGRLVYSSSGVVSDLIAGVYGEEYRLYSAATGGTLADPGGQTLPRPGASLYDDNGNIDEGQGVAPFYQHPHDFTGSGSYVGADPKRINWSTPAGSNHWIQYRRYGNNSVSPSGSNVAWGAAGLMSNTLRQGNGDDPGEVAFYSPNNSVDKILTPDEMLYLQLNNSEIDRLNVNSRLASLLPFNFAKSITDNVRAEAIRRKFTTQSNDRKSYSWPISERSFGATGSGQEYSFDSVTNSYLFPPQFGSVPRFSTSDPFRSCTRSLLEMEWNSSYSESRLQRKLSINQVLAGDSANAFEFRELTPHPNDPGVARVGGTATPPIYPPTTPAGQEYWARLDRQRMARDIYTLLYLLGHGDDAVATATATNASNALYSDTQLREMAQFAVNLVDAMDRDNVITLFEYDKDLHDGWNLDDDPFGTPESAKYQPTVDANYNVKYPNDGPTRGEVFGVERLDLSLSESLVIQAKKSASGTDYAGTNFDEKSLDRFFFYVELLNHSPFPVKFDAKETWQIVLRQEATATSAAWERRLSLRNNFTLDAQNSATGGYPFVIGTADASTPVNPSSGYSRSTFMVNRASWTLAPGPTDRIVPNRPGAANLDCDLDLIESLPASINVPANLYRIEDQDGTDVSATAGAMLSAFTGATPPADMTASGATLKVILRRRAHPSRSYLTPPTLPAVEDNPWVEVDSMMLQSGNGFQTFPDLTSSPTPAAIDSALQALASRERPQPLDSLAELASTGTGVPASNTTVNTLGSLNTSTTTLSVSPYPLWQLHLDRDYASTLDLLQLPVFAPFQLTTLTKAVFTQSPVAQVTVGNEVTSTNWRVGTTAANALVKVFAKSAVAKFVIPEDPANSVAITPDYKMNNRWHRLLELLEVPSRANVNLNVGTDLSIGRVPGRLNLNMIRHPEALAALLDDNRMFNLNLDSASPPNPEAASIDENSSVSNYDASRNWWAQFLASRDPVEPSAATRTGLSIPVQVPLPGLPSSNTVPIGSAYLSDARPFKNLSELGYTVDPTNLGVKHPSVADTLLRALPMDANLPTTSSRRRLFEIGSASEHQSSTLDPYIRNRLLSKINGNTTTRSNCFGIFISVKYFQAVRQNNAIRIGGPLNQTALPEHRGFFVVDRSKLEVGQTSKSPTFDFRQFIDYRKTLQTH